MSVSILLFECELDGGGTLLSAKVDVFILHLLGVSFLFTLVHAIVASAVVLTLKW